MTYLQRKKLAFMSMVNQIKGFVRTISGAPPLTLPDCVDTDSIINYSMEGNSVQDGTPTPETPVEVESVGEKTKNLFDKDNANVFAGYLSSDILAGFVPTFDSRYNITFAIPCEPNKTYTVSRQIISSRFAVGYSESSPAQDISVTFIANQSNQAITITTDDTAKYLYVWFYNGAYDAAYTYEELLSGIQVQEGEVATEYDSYGYKIPIVCSGNNMFDYTKAPESITYGGVNATNNNDGTFLFNGKMTHSMMDYPMLDFLTDDLLPDTTYTVGLGNEYSGDDLRYYIMIQITNSDTGVSRYVSTSSNTHTFTLGSTENVRFMYMRIYSPSGTLYDINNVVFSPYVYRGECEPIFEPYVEPVTKSIYLDEPLRKIGDYADYIDFKNSKVIRQVYCERLNSTNLREMVMTNNTKRFFKPVSKSILSAYRGGYGTVFGISSYKYNDQLTDNEAMLSPTAGFVYIRSDEYTLDEYKNLLDTQNVLIYYALAEKIEQKVKLPELPTVKGTTIYSVATAIQPGGIRVSYYSTVKE